MKNPYKGQLIVTDRGIFRAPHYNYEIHGYPEYRDATSAEMYLYEKLEELYKIICEQLGNSYSVSQKKLSELERDPMDYEISEIAVLTKCIVDQLNSMEVLLLDENAKLLLRMKLQMDLNYIKFFKHLYKVS